MLVQGAEAYSRILWGSGLSMPSAQAGRQLGHFQSNSAMSAVQSFGASVVVHAGEDNGPVRYRGAASSCRVIIQVLHVVALGFGLSIDW